MFFGIIFFDLDPRNPATTRMAAVALLMFIWWITEAIPLFATALLPLVLFPFLGIERGEITAPLYFNSTIALFMGGFMIALTMEKWDLHRRIALKIIRKMNGGPSHIILGFMVAAGFLSMWISNTATAMMMVPIGLAIIIEMENEHGVDDTHNFSVGVMLAIGFACSVGGMATLVGTPPNLVLVRIFQIIFPDAPAISFGQWILLGFPISVIMLVIAWLLITKIFSRVPKHITVDNELVEKQYLALGPPTYEEKMVLAAFVTTALLWVFRVPIQLGVITIPGWSQLIPFPGLIDDGTIAITMSIILFLIPSRTPGAAYPTLAGKDLIPRLPWNIMLIFGGGFALAHGFTVTGLSVLIGNQFSGLTQISPIVIIISVCLTLTFLTEMSSNTATTEMILPILASVAVITNIHPLMLMIPATLAASCAFMMPVATPPNAIIFGSNRVRVFEMAKIGFFLNLAGILVISFMFILLGTAVFGIEAGIIPEWASLGDTRH